MNTQTLDLHPISGLEVVGRGIYLRPRQPYELKDVLFKRDSHWNYHSGETGKTYSVPTGYGVDDSVPMPAGQAMNQTMVEESWERFDKEVGLNTKLAASASVFSINVNANQASNLHSEQDSYYALRSSFIPLWSVYLPSAAGFSEETFTIDVPLDKEGCFSHKYRKEYDKFFDRYGTHYVKRAWVGGRAMLAFIVAKSSDITKEQIQAGIQASFGVLGSGSASTTLQENKAKLQSNSECKVFGKGGNELKLATLSSLDQDAYNAWLATIKDNPQVIELEVAGIWTLISDPKKASALQQAYGEATAFKPISAIFSINRDIYFVKDDSYFTFNLDTKETQIPPVSIKDLVPDLGKPEFAEFQRPDASFVGTYLRSSTDEDLSGKVFLFKRDKFIRVDTRKANTIDPDCYPPKAIAEEWPGVTFDRIDATLNAGPDSVYFFRGDQYIRFNTLNHRADNDKEYPAKIKERWSGVIFDRIDAAIYWKNGKVYFFHGDQYIRYDMATYRADAGYPKFISSNYVQDWEFFE